MSDLKVDRSRVFALEEALLDANLTLTTYDGTPEWHERRRESVKRSRMALHACFAQVKKTAKPKTVSKKECLITVEKLADAFKSIQSGWDKKDAELIESGSKKSEWGSVKDYKA